MLWLNFKASDLEPILSRVNLDTNNWIATVLTLKSIAAGQLGSNQAKIQRDRSSLVTWDGRIPARLSTYPVVTNAVQSESFP